MALLWVEGFEGFGVTDGSAPVGLDFKYPINSGLAGSSMKDGRFNGQAFRIRGVLSGVTTPVAWNIATGIIGLAFRTTTLTGEKIIELRENNNATVGFNIRLKSDGKLEAYLDSTLLNTTASAQIAVDTWYYIELKVTVHNSAGSYELRVNGSNVLSQSGIDTRVGLFTDAFDRVRFCGPNLSSPSGFDYDDIYICSTSGSVNNNFLGARRVLTLFPNGAGDSAQFTPSAGSNYQNVGESPVDSDTTYNESSTSTHLDLFEMDAFSSTADINGIQHNTVARKTAGDNNIKLVAKSDGTQSDGSNVLVNSTSYANQSRILETDPDTSAAWDQAGVDAAQFGYKVG